MTDLEKRTFSEGECFGFMEAVGFFACRGVNRKILMDASEYCAENILKEGGDSCGEGFNVDGCASNCSGRTGA